MSELVLGVDQFVAEWVSRQSIYAPNGFGACTAIGVVVGSLDRRIIIAGVVYHDFHPHFRTVAMSVAAVPKTSWLTRQHLATFFGYPFEQLGCERITSIVARKNKHAREFNERLGFKYEGCARRGFYPDDAMLYGMLKSECRWIGQTELRKAA